VSRPWGSDDATDARHGALRRRYLTEQYPHETAAFAMMAWAFAGWHDEGELEAFSRALFEEKGLAARLHPWVRDVLAFAAAREISTLIVSASPRFLIEAAARALALPVTSAHGMVVARDAAGRLEPRLAEPPTTGQGKLEALRRAHPGATLLGAFGDGGWDAPMVLAARVRVAVGRGSGLAKRQPPIDGLFVLPASDHLAPLAPPAPPGRAVTAFVRVVELVRAFGPGRPAVSVRELSVERGEVMTLVGPSGCGKSTTLRLLAGLERPDRGSVHIDGRDVANVSPQDRDVAMVFQGFALYPHMPVRDILAFPLRMRGEKRAAREARVAEVGELLGLSRLMDRKARAALGRRAAARRHGARARAPAQAVLVRRAAQQPRRRAARRAAHGARRALASARHHRALRHPRSGRGHDARPPHRRDARGRALASGHAAPGLRGARQRVRGHVPRAAAHDRAARPPRGRRGARGRRVPTKPRVTPRPASPCSSACGPSTWRCVRPRATSCRSRGRSRCASRSGPRRTCACELVTPKGERLLAVRLPGWEGPREGERVRLAVPQARLCLFDPETELRRDP
jgi:predicted ABC-type transport system involved in lysophospholipase L1 biosynthesis ATPase subunit/phosphoserine phosphatase